MFYKPEITFQKLISFFLFASTIQTSSGQSKFGVYVPKQFNFESWQSGYCIPTNTTLVECAILCNQAYETLRGCTIFWLAGTRCYHSTYGLESIKDVKRGINIDQTFYARSELETLGQVALIVGGELSGKSISSVEVYSPGGGCQYSLASLPLPLSGLTLGKALNIIVACSGYDTTTLLNNQNCWRYWIPTNRWTLVGKLNSTKPKYPAKTYSGSLYFINDAPGEYFTNYFPARTVPWDVQPPTPVGEGACSVMWGRKMIIFGGGKSNTTVQRYDFLANIWTTLTPMTMAHVFFGCVLLPDRNRVLVVSTVHGGDERRSDIYDILTDTWNVTGSTVNPRAGTSLVTLGKRVFAIGGNWSPSPTSLSATVEEYDTDLGTWSVVDAKLIGARINFAVMALPAAFFSHLAQGCVGVK